MKGRLRRFVRRRIGGNREHALELAVGPIPFAHKLSDSASVPRHTVMVGPIPFAHKRGKGTL